MNGNPFSWPSQARDAFFAWANRVIPSDLFDVEIEEEGDGEAQEG